MEYFYGPESMPSLVSDVELKEGGSSIKNIAKRLGMIQKVHGSYYIVAKMPTLILKIVTTDDETKGTQELQVACEISHTAEVKTTSFMLLLGWQYTKQPLPYELQFPLHQKQHTYLHLYQRIIQPLPFETLAKVSVLKYAILVCAALTHAHRYTGFVHGQTNRPSNYGFLPWSPRKSVKIETPSGKRYKIFGMPVLPKLAEFSTAKSSIYDRVEDLKHSHASDIAGVLAVFAHRATKELTPVFHAIQTPDWEPLVELLTEGKQAIRAKKRLVFAPDVKKE